MKLPFNFLALLLLCGQLLLVLTIIVHTLANGELIPHQYIVKLRDGVDAKSFLDQLVFRTKHGLTFHLKSNVKYTYSTVFNGFSVKLDNNQVNLLYANDKVEYVSQDHKIKLDYSGVKSTQNDGTWGLARLSSGSKLKTFDNTSYTYTYNSIAGTDTYAYIVDSGINVYHEEFEGRAKLGVNYVDFEQNEDTNGHGTHCAGVIAGKTYGVAKNATVISVKAFDSDGSASYSLVLMGVEWAVNDAQKYGVNRCVLSMSLGGRKSRVINEATENVIKLGITVVVAAGNEGKDACHLSPASAPNAITVSASDINDKIAGFSNYGQCVDIFAPGSRIKSASNRNNTAYSIRSGTSMAVPHVVGLVCYFKSIGYDQSPKVVEQVIKEMAAKGVITEMPRNTVNLLVQNDMAF